MIGVLAWLKRRSERFGHLARYHQGGRVSILAFGTDRICRQMNERGEVVSNRANRWHEVLEKKYREAARYPWLPVAPDPPEPE
jgi:hypothetical protein